jgi:6-phosphogluconolactonase
MTADVRILPDRHALTEHAADLLAAELSSTNDLALAGGSTPQATYRALLGRPVDWGRVELWLGDERWVPPDHADSNLAMARRSLGERADRVLPTPWVTGVGPHQAAAVYEQLLRSRLGSPDTLTPGTVLLGIGEDGHTASLFPGTSALDERDRDYVATFVPQLGAWRLTLTLPALHRARLLVFLVAGQEKSSTVARILEGREDLPAALAHRGARRSVWLLDEAAASELRSTESTVSPPAG